MPYKTKIREEKKEEIIREFLPLIKYTAFRYAWRLPAQLTTDDLISVGIMGLLDALSRYKEDIGKLKTFAEHRIKGAMLDELRKHNWLPESMMKKVDRIKKESVRLEKILGRTPDDYEIADNLDMSLDEYHHILQTSSFCIMRFDDLVDKNSEDSGLDATESLPDFNTKTPLEVLEEKQKKEMIAEIIAGLPEKEKLLLSLYYYEEMTMKEIANILEITEGRVSQLHNQAIMRIRAKLDHNNKNNKNIKKTICSS